MSGIRRRAVVSGMKTSHQNINCPFPAPLRHSASARPGARRAARGGRPDESGVGPGLRESQSFHTRVPTRIRLYAVDIQGAEQSEAQGRITGFDSTRSWYRKAHVEHNRGQPFAVMGFTVARGKIVEIDTVMVV